MIRLIRSATLAATLVTVIACAAPSSASAVSTGGVLCSLTGLVSGVAGKVCTAANHAGQIVSAGKKLLGGHVGGALKAITGSKAGKAATAAAGALAIVALAVGGARYLLRETASVIGSTTRPNLESSWFSASYWRMAAVSALLTLPFLFAAAIQALIRSDLAMLARATFGYLPLGLIAVGIAAPLTMLLLAASDEMSSIVASASGHADTSFLTKVSALTGLAALSTGTQFVAFFVALLTAAATIVLWIELLIRDAAIYVVVLMLPLFFAAMVWPARRIWAVRAVEMLVALILSKFAIVAVLSLGGAALGHTFFPGPAAMLSGATLVLLAAFSPWALLRLLPLHELASTAVGGLRMHGTMPALDGARRAEGVADRVEPAIAQLSEATPRDMDPQSSTDRVDGATNGRPQPEDVNSAGPGVAAADEFEVPSTQSEPAMNGARATPSEPLWEPPPRGEGMEPHWKTPDSDWRVIPLADREDLKSPPPMVPPQPEAQQPDPPHPAAPQPEPPQPEPPQPEPPPTADDRDRLPPTQENDE